VTPVSSPTDADEAAVLQAAEAVGLTIPAASLAGVVVYYRLARSMAQVLDSVALTPADESRSVFRPVVPRADGSTGTGDEGLR
jgi:hypothetical protein